MGLTPQTQTIDGHKWTVCPFPARRAIQLKVRLAKMVGPAIGELIPALGALGKDDVKAKIATKDDAKPDEQAKANTPNALEGNVEMALAAVPRVFQMLAQNLGEVEFTQTILDLMALSSRDDTQISEDYFDREFAGNFGEMYKALGFILKVNYSDFLKGLASSGIGRSLAALAPESPKTSPSTSAPSKE